MRANYVPLREFVSETHQGGDPVATALTSGQALTGQGLCGSSVSGLMRCSDQPLYEMFLLPVLLLVPPQLKEGE